MEMEAGGSKRPDRTWGSVLGVRGIHLAWLTSVRAHRGHPEGSDGQEGKSERGERVRKQL